MCMHVVNRAYPLNWCVVYFVVGFFLPPPHKRNCIIQQFRSVWQYVSKINASSSQAENVFMIARGIVREARENVEAQQIKLKEIRDRLDRVSRDDSQYLELATLEHRLLQVIYWYLSIGEYVEKLCALFPSLVIDCLCRCSSVLK